MTVRELIENLQQLDPDLYVVTQGYEGGYCDVNINGPFDIALNVNTEWYYGPHEGVRNDFVVQDKSKYTIVKGILI